MYEGRRAFEGAVTPERPSVLDRKYKHLTECGGALLPVNINVADCVWRSAAGSRLRTPLIDGPPPYGSEYSSPARWPVALRGQLRSSTGYCMFEGGLAFACGCWTM